MAKFALQDKDLFYGVYEADDRDMAIFHLLTHEPFSIQGLGYDHDSKEFTYFNSGKSPLLLVAIDDMRYEAEELVKIIVGLRTSSLFLMKDDLVFFRATDCVLLHKNEPELIENFLNKGYEPYNDAFIQQSCVRRQA